MRSTIASQKAALRISTRKQLTSLSPQDRQTSDQALFDAFLALPEAAQAKTFFLFWGITGLEPDTRALADRLRTLGKIVCLPRVVENFGMECRIYRPELPMAATPYGVLEPTEDCALIPREEIDLALIPALCYDQKGFRLGYGAGYYDRWLQHYRGLTAGLCRESALQHTLPVESHDLPVQIVVTERRVIRP